MINTRLRKYSILVKTSLIISHPSIGICLHYTNNKAVCYTHLNFRPSGSIYSIFSPLAVYTRYFGLRKQFAEFILNLNPTKSIIPTNISLLVWNWINVMQVLTPNIILHVLSFPNYTIVLYITPTIVGERWYCLPFALMFCRESQPCIPKLVEIVCLVCIEGLHLIYWIPIKRRSSWRINTAYIII